MFNSSMDLALQALFISLIIVGSIWIIVLLVRSIPKSDQGQSNTDSSQLQSLTEMAAKINKRKRRIDAGDTKLAELQAALYAASDAQEEVEEAEMAAARKRSEDSPEYAAWLAASQRLDNYEKELDAAAGK